MGDTWITDMSHFNYTDEEAYILPKEGIRLAKYFESIIEATIGRFANIKKSTGIRCRRCPRRIPCSGFIHSELHPNGTELRWWCPVCGDNGHISNWIDTRWDPARKQQGSYVIQSGKLFDKEPIEKDMTEEEYENIQSTIEWDDTFDGELPKTEIL